MNLRELDSFKLSDSIKFHATLNPVLFDDEHLDPEVRNQLLLIAQDFIEHLGITDFDVKDITLSGSNAAYTYTPHSDIDLHILVDIDKLRNNEVYREFFNTKKVVYNNTHDINIHGYDVELYIQDSTDPVQSLGEYSVLNDRWIKFPVKRKANLDQTASKEKFKKLIQLSELALRTSDVSKIDSLLDTIRKYRQAGLDEHGEFGPENLAYKALRSHGVVDQLYKHAEMLHSQDLSLPEEAEPTDDGLAASLMQELSEFSGVKTEDYDPNGTPPGPEFKPTMPKGTVRVDVSDVYDWYKLGQNISNLDRADKKMFGKGPPSTIVSFGSEDAEHNYINSLNQLGLDTTDIDPVDPNQPRGMKRQKVDPTYNVNENSPEGSDDAAETFKAHLIRTLPQIMKLFANVGKGWSPSKEQMLAAVDTGYMVMKHTGDAKQAGKAVMDELNTLYRINQGVAEGAQEQELLKYQTAKALLKVKVSLTAEVEKELARTGWKKDDPGYEKEFSAMASYYLNYGVPGRYINDLAAKATSLDVDFLKNLLNILQQKYPNTEFNLESDRVESNDGELTVIADTAEEGRYVGCFMWDVSTGPYKGALELAIKQTTDQLLQANPGKKPALFIGGDNQNPEAWKYIAKKLKYKLITEDDDMFEQGMSEGSIRIPVTELSVNRNATVHKWQLRNDQNFKLSDEVPSIILKDVTVAIDEQAYDQERSLFAFLQGERTNNIPEGLTEFPIAYRRNGVYPFIDKRTGEPIERVDYVKFDEQGKVTGYKQGLAEAREFKEQDLFEINMGGKSLRREAAKTGANAGMEFEMIVPDVSGDDDDDDANESEPDWDANESARTVDDIRRFFYDGEYNGLRDVNRLIDLMQSDHRNWRAVQFDSRWDSDKEEFIYNYLKDNISDDDIRDLLDLDPDDDINRREYLMAADSIATSELDPWYEDAKTDAQEQYSENNDFDEWLNDADLDSMRDIHDRYSGDVQWPYYTEPEPRRGGGKSVQNVADSFSAAVGRPAKTSDSYHSRKQERPGYDDFYVVEPDGSLDPDDPANTGLEFVSPYMPIDKMLVELNKVKQWADRNDCYTNKSTGLHINISVPNYSQDKLDYVKLALLMGDEYVLKQFGRVGNAYAKSALGKVRDRVRDRPFEAEYLFDKMKGHMGELASKAIHSGITDKYTSVNTKDGHIEFRSPGGDWLNDNFSMIENTLLRFTVAMSAALDPEAYRQEYLKKLYKLLAPKGENDPLAIFAKYSAGELPKAALKNFVRQAQLARGNKAAKITSGQPNDPTGEYAIVRRSDSRSHGWGGEAPDYLFRFNLPDDFDIEDLRQHLEDKLSAWAARENVNAADYMTVMPAQFAAPGQTATRSRPPGGRSPAQPATPESGSVQWNIINGNNEIVHTFWNRNVQADANEVARQWLIRNDSLPSVDDQEPFEVVRATSSGNTQAQQRQAPAASNITNPSQAMAESSGYIPSEKEKNDPRWKTALTVDVHPDSIKKNASKLGLGKIKRTGIPPQARSDGKF